MNTRFFFIFTDLIHDENEYYSWWFCNNARSDVLGWLHPIWKSVFMCLMFTVYFCKWAWNSIEEQGFCGFVWFFFLSFSSLWSFHKKILRIESLHFLKCHCSVKVSKGPVFRFSFFDLWVLLGNCNNIPLKPILLLLFGSALPSISCFGERMTVSSKRYLGNSTQTTVLGFISIFFPRLCYVRIK